MKKLAGVTLAGLLALGVVGCRKSSPYAEGSGYGVGRARTHFMFGDMAAAKGTQKMGIENPNEAGIGRVAPQHDEGTQAKGD